MTQLNKIGKVIEKGLAKPIGQVKSFLKRNPWAWIFVGLIVASIAWSAILLVQQKVSGEGFGSNEDLYGGDSGVRELSSDDFTASNDILLKDYLGKKGLVVFYSPNCGHCRTMAPAAKNASQEINQAKSFIAAVNCLNQTELANSVGVMSYPTIKLVGPDGSMKEYGGGRSMEDIIKAVQ